jgi:hypothetical protein
MLRYYVSTLFLSVLVLFEYTWDSSEFVSIHSFVPNRYSFTIPGRASFHVLLHFAIVFVYFDTVFRRTFHSCVHESLRVSEYDRFGTYLCARVAPRLTFAIEYTRTC